ncbi:YjdF family protein [Kitasatospora sp. NPDC086791]|uniref:YjdF family protein n=1 Tax=Kitasatospora sp. NPDC086791 TaxID=3155178 RepID=UPI003436D74A
MPSTFSVFFDDPFWVGVLEIAGPDGVRAARHVFGAEPGNAELLEFVRRDFGRLLGAALAAPEVTVERRARRQPVNPKRLARQAAKELAARPLSTAAEEALTRAHEEAGHLNRAAAKRRAAEDARERRESARRQAGKRHRGR